MSVTNLNITQSNITITCNLLSVHNPLVFIVDAEYSGIAPDLCTCQVSDENDAVLGLFSMIPYEDKTNRRTFIFIADSFLRSFMESFDDIKTEEKFFAHVPNMTKLFKLKFECENEETNMSFYGCHSVAQFGETECRTNITGNENTIYYGGENKPIYIYFYNSNPSNNITINTPISSDNYALDNDFAYFKDEDGYFFLID